MNSQKKITTVLIALIVLSTAFTHAEIPAAAQKEIDQLVQQDKFTEALAKVDALLKAPEQTVDRLVEAG